MSFKLGMVLFFLFFIFSVRADTEIQIDVPALLEETAQLAQTAKNHLEQGHDELLASTLGELEAKIKILDQVPFDDSSNLGYFLGFAITIMGINTLIMGNQFETPLNPSSYYIQKTRFLLASALNLIMAIYLIKCGPDLIPKTEEEKYLNLKEAFNTLRKGEELKKSTTSKISYSWKTFSTAKTSSSKE